MDALLYGGWLSPEGLQAISQGLPLGGASNGGGGGPPGSMGGAPGGGINSYPPPPPPHPDMYSIPRLQGQQQQQQQRVGAPGLPQMMFQQQQQQQFSPRGLAGGMGASAFPPRPQHQPWSGHYADNYGEQQMPPPIMTAGGGGGGGYPNYPPPTQQQGPLPMALPAVPVNQQPVVPPGGGSGGRYDNGGCVNPYSQQDPGFNIQSPQMAAG